MANAVFCMKTYDEYLRGRPFMLFLDERPEPELSHLHKKTLARFTALSLEYNFVIQSKTGSGMPLFLWSSPAQVQQHPFACANCAQLKVHKQNNSVPNAVVHLDIHGPFPSYGDKKFIAVFTARLPRLRHSRPCPTNPQTM